MIQIRKSADRGYFDHGWLETYHTFSFGDYQDPAHMEFSVLRVINEDRVIPSEGFDTHAHANMEIVTYVIEGALKHVDSTGPSSLIKPGDVQRMTAGKGIQHSEFNASDKEPVHLLQIWLYPEKRGLAPGYEQKNFPDLQNRLCLVVSHEGKDGSLKIHQDVSIFASKLQGKTLSYSLAPGRKAWIQVIEGPLTCNGQTLQSGDGAAITDERELKLESSRAHFLLFDLPS